MNVFESLELSYDNITDQKRGFYSFLPTNMVEMKMMIKTRPRYPTNKLTFSIANQAKGKHIHFVKIKLDSDADFHVAVSLEDSKRNFLNSFLRFISFEH